MGRIISIANQKGGVGKTTTAINLAVALAELGRRVLLLDLDPQGNATSGVSQREVATVARESGRTIYQVLIGETPLAQVTIPVRATLDLAPAGADLVGAEIELVAAEGRERRLKMVLGPLVTDYNYVLIDTPPSLGILTLNALVAADSVLVPMQCEYYALEGLSALLGTIKKVKAAFRPGLEIEGLLLTMFDARNRLSHEIAGEIRSHFPAETFKSVIPRSVRLSESPSHGLSVLEYESKSSGAAAYRALAAEIIRKREAGAEVAEQSAAPADKNDETDAAAGKSRLARLFGRR
ncbi:ParA family protein [Candidatus Binatus sp.]|uniref:ParA family protein n=1 Tax=Candidatus Binatus sp. TaxID=2811406 RepID=UPI00351D6E68